jgi:DNA-binding transcriptional ArsR family regulator
MTFGFSPRSAAAIGLSGALMRRHYNGQLRTERGELAGRYRTRLCCGLIYSYMGIDFSMARAATTADAFNAVAEPRRRQILDALVGGERPVNDLVRLLGLAQPQVSKHLRVLREVGAVDVREEGRRRLYRLNGHALKPIHDWVKTYERLWSERFDRLDVVLEDLKQKEEGDGSDE